MNKTITAQDYKKLCDLLRQGFVEFTYIKKDGTTRQAIGTRNVAMVEKMGGDAPMGTGEVPENTLPYWDYDRQAWRSFRTSSIVDEFTVRNDLNP